MISFENFSSLIPFYLLGCFPTGVFVAKLYGVSITKQGSKNVGATNVARVVGKKAGIITLLGDMLKGIVGVLIAKQVFKQVFSLEIMIAAASFCVVAGHCLSLPPFLKGGKGVATSLGALGMLAPLAALSALVVFIISFLCSKIVSLSSILAAIAAVICAYIFESSEPSFHAVVLIATLIIARHYENISRLLTGTEGQFKIAGKI